MSCDKLTVWIEQNMDTLSDKFIEQNRDKFEEWCFAEFESYQADQTDYLFEQLRDRKIEEQHE